MRRVFPMLACLLDSVHVDRSSNIRAIASLIVCRKKF